MLVMKELKVNLQDVLEHALELYKLKHVSPFFTTSWYWRMCLCGQSPMNRQVCTPLAQMKWENPNATIAYKSS